MQSPIDKIQQIDPSVVETIPIFDGLTPAEKMLLTQHMVSQLYASGEPIPIPSRSAPAMYFIEYGSVCAYLPTPPTLDAESMLPVLADDWDSHTLEKITVQLTKVMGPVAQLLVEQAVTQTNDPYQLYHNLAQEIASPEEREVFLQNTPAYASVKLVAGEFFGETTLLTGVALPAVKIETMAETAVWIISKDSIRELATQNKGSLAILGQNLTKYHPNSRLHAVEANHATAPETLLTTIRQYYDLDD